jgi:hypothetical protein
LAKLEEEFRRSCVRQGAILREIRDRELFRERGYQTFESYVKDFWGIARSTAWAAMGIDEVMTQIPEIQSASHARALIAAPPDRRQEAWESAKELAGSVPVTAKHVESVVKSRQPKLDDDQKDVVEDVRQDDEPACVPDPEPACVPDPEPTDDEWLATLPVRSELPPHIRVRFDADAVLFRHATPIRLEFVEKFRPLAKRAKKNADYHIGAWMSRAYRFFQGDDPSRWLVCGHCSGQGELKLIGRCPKCRGQGYLI